MSAQAVKRLTAAEQGDRAALRLVRDHATRSTVARKAGAAALRRMLQRGHAVRDEASEYSDVLALTWDGTDYLAVLEESWHD